jgi:putative tricarboxylic transport membrane protein
VLVNLAFIPAFVWVLRMPFTILAPIIFILCIIGGYAPTQDMHDVWLMFLFSVVGYLMRKLDYPMAPAVLAIVLGPQAEASMRQSLIINHGNPMIFFERAFPVRSWRWRLSYSCCPWYRWSTADSRQQPTE